VLALRRDALKAVNHFFKHLCAMAVAMTWWIWVLAVAVSWFGVSIAVVGLWAALHRSPR
jgi:hypothetical protein